MFVIFVGVFTDSRLILDHRRTGSTQMTVGMSKRGFYRRKHYQLFQHMGTLYQAPLAMVLGILPFLWRIGMATLLG